MDMKVSENNFPALKLIATKRPLVIGHRGYCQLAPENTLPSFKLAVAAGADLVELDYHHSRDGKLVVIHDGILDRTTDARKRWGHGQIKVSSRTAAEIQSLDAGKWFAPRFSGTKIPLLAEALEMIQKGSMTLIERKAGDPAACIELLREKHLINKVIVQSFDWEYLRAFHQEEPRQILAALGPPTLMPGGRRPLRVQRDLSARRLRQLQHCGARIAVWNRSVSKRAVQRAHAHGLTVWVYTVNDPRLANRLLDKGVDGLITNNPSLIWRTIALRSAKLE
ncbi:MAG: glycerophosphoryl diester phosphodiesterase [Verrucomicrobiota bacterium]